MDEVLKTLLPTAATLLGGPFAGFAVKFLADKLGVPEQTQDAVTKAVQSMSATPEDRIKLAQIDAELKEHALQSGLDLQKLAVQNAADINATMQTEAKSDHWPTYTWRPFIGFCFGTAWIGVYLLLPILKGYVPSIIQPTIPSEAWIAIGGILGVASWFRGKAQADPNIPTDNRG